MPSPIHPPIYTGGTPFLPKDTGSFHPATNTGYDVRAVDKRQGYLEEQRKPGSRNAQLHNSSQYVNFFCNEIKMSFELSGTTAQSRFVMDFYAHNIVMPSILIMGESLNQEEYANLVEFVRDSQRKCVEGNTLMQLIVDRGGGNIYQGEESLEEEKSKRNTDHEKDNNRSIVKGHHKAILALGFIKTMPRVHKKFEYSPKFDFEFTISQMLESAVYDEASEGEPYQKSYAEIIKNLVYQEPTKAEIIAAAKPRVEQERREKRESELNAAKSIGNAHTKHAKS